jgi:hypothetical protein
VTDQLGHGSTVWSRAIDPLETLPHAMRVDVSAARDLEAKPVGAPRPA